MLVLRGRRWRLPSIVLPHNEGYRWLREGAATRPHLALVLVLDWFPKDLFVISFLCGVRCTTGYLQYRLRPFSQKKKKNERVCWLARAHVHTEKYFSQAAFFREMKPAWNPTQEVRFRLVGANLFVVQASCLDDWERIIHHGPWIFRFWAVLLMLYDGLSRAEDA